MAMGLLTGTLLAGANPRKADLQKAGLGAHRSEGADLRALIYARIVSTGARRSGLVGSVIPCEGSKTGFILMKWRSRPSKWKKFARST
jgi:hypothetical protein